MNRREVLRFTALLSGSAVSASLAGVILSGCSKPQAEQSGHEGSDASDLSVLHFFAPEQFKLVTLIADTVLPRTDSPSATDVGVHRTIDSMLGLVFKKADQTAFKQVWAGLERYLVSHRFAQLEPDAQVEALRALELSTDAALADARHAFIDLKQQVIAYYLTSKEIGENYLNYSPVPGEYEPCISVEQVNNRAWAI
jgi:hypothetical protein